jgi:Ca-activated chloride channel family protein
VSFTWPLGLLVLLVVPAVLALAVVADRRRAKFPVAFTNLSLLAGVVEERRRSWRRWVPLVLLLLALTFAAGAVARPRTHVSVPDQNATVVLLVDVSGSMRANDVEPTRLDAALAAMRVFLDKLPSQFKVGLVAFSSEPTVLSQPTGDRDAVRSSLNYLEPEAATAIGDGLEVAVRMIKTTMARTGVVRKDGEDLPAAVVLLSDGQQNRGLIQPLKAAQDAHAAGIRVYAVSLGTPNGKVTFGFGAFVNKIPVPPDPATMQAIASETGGQAFTAETSSTLSKIYQTLGSSLGRRRKLEEITSWFAGAAALLLVAAVASGRLLEGRLP